MKNNVIGKLAVLSLALSGALTIGAMAQTTDPGPGPTEQPNAPMEIGQQQEPDMQAPAQEEQPGDAQPTEAQPGGPEGEGPATTDQGVGRLSLIHGDVSTQRGDSGDWSAAALNQPVMAGDKVSTGDNARTEVQLDFANVLRIGPNSKANVATLTKKNIQIQLSQGIANYTVSKDSEAEPEIDTPNVSVHPAHHDGVFRIEIQPDGDTIVIVRQGEAQIATPQGSTEVHAGEMATVRGDTDNAQYKISEAPDRDAWDQWNSDRDHMIRNASSWRHTNRYYTGTQDLDAYGKWENVPDYGDVWVPNEPEDWAPYRNGNWVYEPYYGWTWVGYEPWGWAPYHYGRWMWLNGGWGWWPGPVYGWYRPFWAPAYVSFWGWGGGFGFGFGWGGWGGFGWLPLGPCDWFHPWWGGYRGRFGWAGRGWQGGGFGGFRPLHGGMRFSNVAHVNDPHIGRGLSVVNAGHFGGGRITAAAATREQIGGARMMAGNLPVVPSRASLSASGRAASPSTIRNSGPSRFYGTHNNISRPASFTHETSTLRQSMASSHVGGIPAGGVSSASFSRAANGTMSRPSAGVANRESSGFSNRGTSSMNGGSRSFTPPNSTNRSSMPERSNSGFGNSRGTNQSPSRDGFRPFTPPSNSGASRGAMGSSAESGGYWNRTAPSASSSRGYSDGFGRGSAGSRPQLDMHQPIVRGPSYGASRGGYGYGGYGGYHAPSYGGSRPSYGGGSRPSYGGGSRPSYGGGSRSAPSGGHVGGGHSSGGGGGHSGGGGGHGGHR